MHQSAKGPDIRESSRTECDPVGLHLGDVSKFRGSEDDAHYAREYPAHCLIEVIGDAVAFSEGAAKHDDHVEQDETCERGLAALLWSREEHLGAGKSAITESSESTSEEGDLCRIEFEGFCRSRG